MDISGRPDTDEGVVHANLIMPVENDAKSSIPKQTTNPVSVPMIVKVNPSGELIKMENVDRESQCINANGLPDICTGDIKTNQIQINDIQTNVFGEKTETVSKDSNPTLTVTLCTAVTLGVVADYQSDIEDNDPDPGVMDTTPAPTIQEKQIDIITGKTGEQNGIVTIGSESSISSSDSSDTESSSSDTASDSSNLAVTGTMDSEAQNEVKESVSARLNNQKKSKNVNPKEHSGLQEELPKIIYRDITLPENVVLVQLGHVSSIIGQLVVLQSDQGINALDLDSVIFKENRQALGSVFDVFGPVAAPLYSIAFNSAEDIAAQNVTLRMPVFFAPDIKDVTSYVFTEKLRMDKGSDASWKDDGEPPVDCLDYSDDEKERQVKAERREGKEKGPRRKKPQRQEKRYPSANDRDGKTQRPNNQRQPWSRNGRPQNEQWHLGGPPVQHRNRPFGGNKFQNNQGRQHMPTQPGNSFSSTPSMHETTPRHPPSFFPSQFIDSAPITSFNNAAPRSQEFWADRVNSIHNRPFGDYGGVPLGPVNSIQDTQTGMFQNFEGIWRAPLAPPPPPNGDFTPPPRMPPHMQPPYPPNCPGQFSHISPHLTSPPPPPPPVQSDFDIKFDWQNRGLPPGL